MRDIILPNVIALDTLAIYLGTTRRDDLITATLAPGASGKRSIKRIAS